MFSNRFIELDNAFMSENPRNVNVILARMQESLAHFPTEEQPQGDEFSVPSLYDRAPIEGERMSGNRDTQFQGFAKLLFDDVVDMFSNRFIELDNGERQEAEETKQSILEVFAECAFALVAHTIAHTSHIELDRMLPEEHAAIIPDLTEWPKESE